MIMMVIIMADIDDKHDELDHHAAEQKKQFPSHVHMITSLNLNIEKGANRLSLF